MWADINCSSYIKNWIWAKWYLFRCSCYLPCTEQRHPDQRLFIKAALSTFQFELRLASIRKYWKSYIASWNDSCLHLVLWHESWLGRLVFLFICIYFSHSLPAVMLESFWMCFGLPASLNSIAQLSQVSNCDTTRWQLPFAGWQQFCSSKEDSLIIMVKNMQQSTFVVACRFRVRNHLCSFNPVFDSFQSVEWFEDDC